MFSAISITPIIFMCVGTILGILVYKTYRVFKCDGEIFVKDGELFLHISEKDLDHILANADYVVLEIRHG